MTNKPDAGVVVIAICMVLIIAMSVGLGYVLHERVQRADAADFTAVSELAETIKRHFYFYDDAQSDETLVNDALRGMIAGLDDPYAAYLTGEEYEEMLAEDAGDYQGIGITVLAPDAVGSRIDAVYTGSPAEKAGLRTGDVITVINGKTAAGLTLDAFIDAFSDSADVPDEITVLRDGESMTFTVRRGEVHVNRVVSELIDGDVGYVHISGFLGSVATEFWEAVTGFQAQGVTKLVVDLRNNPGGGLTEVLAVANHLIPKGQVIATIRSKTEAEEVYKSKGDERITNMDIAVLVNGNSASASEFLTGALQDHGLATVVGTQTYGKGIVQSYYRLKSNGGWAKITTEAYYTPSGTCVHGVGITPDIVCELPEEMRYTAIEQLEHDADTQLQAAIAALDAAQKQAA